MFEFVLILFIALLLCLCFVTLYIKSESKKLRSQISNGTLPVSSHLGMEITSMEKELKKQALRIRVIIVALIILTSIGFIFS